MVKFKGICPKCNHHLHTLDNVNPEISVCTLCGHNWNHKQERATITRKLGDCHERVLTGKLVIVCEQFSDFALPFNMPARSNKDGFSLNNRRVLIYWDGKWTLWRHKDAPATTV